jgi:hypothetical protein
MQISCPGCGFSRDVADEKLPPNSTLATCPKCAKKFKFRDLPVFMPYDLESPAERARPMPPLAAQPEPEQPGPEENVFPAALNAPGTPEAPNAPGAPETAENTAEPETARAEPKVRRVKKTRMPATELLAEDFASGATDAKPEPDRPEGERKKPVRKISLDDDRDAYAASEEPYRARRDESDAYEDAPPPERLGPAAKAKEKAGELWAKLRQEPRSDREGGGEGSHDDFSLRGDDEEYDLDESVAVIPWERHDRFGFFPAFFLTLKMILTQPARFFASLRLLGGGRTNALAFSLIIVELFLLIDFAWSLAGPMSKFSGPERQEMLGQLGSVSAAGLLMGFILFPLFLGFLSYIDALATVVLLKILRTPEVDFFATHRLVCYSAAPGVILAVPVAGSLLLPLLLVWNIVLQALGVREIHRVSMVYSLAVALIKWTIYLVLLFAAWQTMAPHY